MKINGMEKTAVIFDMDGVIFDSEKFYLDCIKEVAEKYGMENAEEVAYRCIGVTSGETQRILLEAYGEDFPLEQYWDEVSRIFRVHYRELGQLPMKDGVRELLTFLKEKGLPCAIGSSTKTEILTQELADAGILDFFTVLVGGDQVERSKPEPDVFLRAAELLGREPSACVVIEDSYNGIRAAEAAGMTSVMVPDLLAPTEEMKEKAWRIVPGLTDVIPLFEEE